MNDPAEADSGDISDRFRSGKDTGESDSEEGRTPRSQIPQWEGYRGVTESDYAVRLGHSGVKQRNRQNTAESVKRPRSQ